MASEYATLLIRKNFDSANGMMKCNIFFEKLG